MARHWSVFVSGVTEKQAYALDKMAERHNKGDGMDLLTEQARCSRSKIGKMDRLSLRKYIDQCFELYAVR